jgi:aspartate aminotransferase
MILANRLDRIEVPQTIKMAKLGRELTAQGKDVINLSLGEPDFPTPDHIINAAIQAMHDGFTKYTPVSGMPDAKQAICAKLKRDNNLDYTPDEIIISTGAKQSLANAVLAIINPGDEVIIPTPYWVTYKGLVDLAEGKTIEVNCPAENGFKIKPEQLEAAINEKTKLFMFSSPCNPSGAVYTKEELAALVTVFEKYPHVNILSDEIYEYINYVGKHESIGQFASIKDRVMVVNGLSKGFAMTGWRLGYLAGPKELVAACDELQGQITSGTNSITQKTTVAALTQSLEPTYKMLEEFKKRRDYVVAELISIPGIQLAAPDGAFYVFPNVSSFFGKHGVENSLDFAMYILDNIYVSTVSGDAFGNNNCIRISYAASMEQLQEAMSRLKKLLNAY